MDKARPENNNSNRRKAFRIYEQVDLLFHKTEFNEEQFVATSYSHKNETLRINISSTDILLHAKKS